MKQRGYYLSKTVGKWELWFSVWTRLAPRFCLHFDIPYWHADHVRVDVDVALFVAGFSIELNWRRQCPPRRNLGDMLMRYYTGDRP